MAFGVGLATPQLASAHDIGWRWDYFGGYTIIEDRTTSYGYFVEMTGIDYNNNTDLHVDGCETTGCGRTVFLQGDWGETGWHAGAVPYDNGNPCVDWPYLNSTGNCDSFFRKADFAYIYINTNYGTLPYPDWILRHEMGHPFGLAHTACSVSSVMRPAACLTGPSSLTTHDISDINGMY